MSQLLLLRPVQVVESVVVHLELNSAGHEHEVAVGSAIRLAAKGERAC